MIRSGTSVVTWQGTFLRYTCPVSESGRPYRQSHPWLTFRMDLSRAPPSLWALLGQALAMCRQVATAILPAPARAQLRHLYLTKGAQATTAIEGNTLSDEEVEAVIEGTANIPPSRAYQETELRNVVQAFDETLQALDRDPDTRLTPDRIAAYNRGVLNGLEERLEEGVVPGEIPEHSVGVRGAGYRGAPRSNCDYLLAELCRMVEPSAQLAAAFPPDAENRMATALAHAIRAHLYIAWIHPYGDGNGRTARLVEFFLLVRAGVAPECAHLLSNHYNRTRPSYYYELQRASAANRGAGDPLGFVVYALRGFVDGLREQIRDVERFQERIAWDSFVQEVARAEGGSAAMAERRHGVAVALADTGPTRMRAIPGLTPDLARRYAGKALRTLSRDLRWLVEHGLLRETDGAFTARTDLLRAIGLSTQQAARDDAAGRGHN